jgi:hypothetical protein
MISLKNKIRTGYISASIGLGVVFSSMMIDIPELPAEVRRVKEINIELQSKHLKNISLNNLDDLVLSEPNKEIKEKKVRLMNERQYLMDNENYINVENTYLSALKDYNDKALGLLLSGSIIFGSCFVYAERKKKFNKQ